MVDNRGFTGHEMLDQLDLVHMNGRVYDPLTAKFLSGDPLVQDPLNGQNYNRYTYVFNNPTNLTDPTGFAAAGDYRRDLEEALRERKNAEAKGARVSYYNGDSWGAKLDAAINKAFAKTMATASNRSESANKPQSDIAKFFSDLKPGETAIQFGRRLMADFADNNRGQFGFWGWAAEKVDNNFERPDDATAERVVAKVGATAAAMMTPGGARGTIAKEIQLSRKLHGEAAVHAADSIAAGKPSVLTIDRAAAPANRSASIGALDKVPGKHLDEYPPAMFREGGGGASVRAINPRDNMSAGACIGNACRGLPDGTKVRITVGD